MTCLIHYYLTERLGEWTLIVSQLQIQFKILHCIFLATIKTMKPIVHFIQLTRSLLTGKTTRATGLIQMWEALPLPHGEA